MGSSILFTDIPYGTINFEEIESFLKNNFSYVDYFSNFIPAFGRSYIIGYSIDNAIKLDVFYVDSFMWQSLFIDGIRMASIEEIIAMKMDVIQRIGRKKDFWDLHELLGKYSIAEMIFFHKKRYPYTHEKELLIHNLTFFDEADNDFDPICYRGKYWEFIKADFEEMINKYKS